MDIYIWFMIGVIFGAFSTSFILFLVNKKKNTSGTIHVVGNDMLLEINKLEDITNKNQVVLEVKSR